jgi:hypothetical protein
MTRRFHKVPRHMLAALTYNQWVQTLASCTKSQMLAANMAQRPMYKSAGSTTELCRPWGMELGQHSLPDEGRDNYPLIGYAGQ